MPEQLLNLNPRNSIHYSFLDNTDGTIIDAYTTIFQDDKYNKGEPVVGFQIVVDTEDGHEPISKFLKMGSVQQIAPNEDKTGFKLIGQTFKGFSDKAAGMYFLTSLANNQYPESALEEGVDVKKLLVGLRAHFETEEIPIGKDGKASYTIITKIYALPPHLKGGSSKANTKSNGKKYSTKSEATANTSKEEIDQVTMEYLFNKLMSGEFTEGIEKVKLAPMVMNDPTLKDDSNQMKISMRIFKDDFLAKDGMPWRYDQSEKKVYLAE